jgi:hypothetical protein
VTGSDAAGSDAAVDVIGADEATGADASSVADAGRMTAGATAFATGCVAG